MTLHAESDTAPVVLTDEQQGLLDDLRNLVDWLGEHPEHIRPIGIYQTFFGASDKVKAEFVRHALDLGTAEKSADDNYFNVTKRFGQHKIVLSISRSAVCEKRTVVKEVEEWFCPDSLHELATLLETDAS